MQHLLIRTDRKANEGYAYRQEAEAALDDLPHPQAMSNLTEKLLGSIDCNAICKQRNRNSEFLHKSLAKQNGLSMDLERVDGPLASCPLLIREGAEIRERLIKNQAFVARHWPNALARCSGFEEENLINNLPPIPRNQRCDTDDLQRVIDLPAN